MTDIKPRVEDGVPWCDAGCPQARDVTSFDLMCDKDGKYRNFRDPPSGAVHSCTPAVKRMAVELEAWRDERLSKTGIGKFTAWIENGPHGAEFNIYNTIEEAADALMAEREE